MLRPSDRERARAVADTGGVDFRLVEHGQQQVAHGRPGGGLDVLATLVTTQGTADQQVRDRVMAVYVAFSHAAPVQDHGVVEQAAVAILGLGQAVQEAGKQADVVRIDLRVLRHLLRLVAVVRGRMVLVGNTDLRIGPVVQLARHHESADAGHVRLKRKHVKVAHHLHVLAAFVAFRNHDLNEW